MDQPEVFQWRIRNLHYDESNFQLSVDAEARVIVIRTVNKKYFKKLNIPELDVLQLPVEPSRLQWHHANSTLVVSYNKPPMVLQAEKEDREARRATKASTEDGNVDCKQQ